MGLYLLLYRSDMINKTNKVYKKFNNRNVEQEA